MVLSFTYYLLTQEIEVFISVNSFFRNLLINIQSGLDTKPVGRSKERSTENAKGQRVECGVI